MVLSTFTLLCNYHLHSLNHNLLPPSTNPAMVGWMSSHLASPDPSFIIFSFSPPPRCSQLLRAKWLDWDHLNNPESSPHLKVLNVIMYSKISFAMWSNIFTGSRNYCVDIFEGPLFCPPPRGESGGGWWWDELGDWDWPVYTDMYKIDN